MLGLYWYELQTHPFPKWVLIGVFRRKKGPENHQTQECPDDEQAPQNKSHFQPHVGSTEAACSLNVRIGKAGYTRTLATLAAELPGRRSDKAGESAAFRSNYTIYSSRSMGNSSRPCFLSCYCTTDSATVQRSRTVWLYNRRATRPFYHHEVSF